MLETAKVIGGPTSIRPSPKISHPQIIVIPPNMFLSSNATNSKNMIVVNGNASNSNIVRNFISLSNGSSLQKVKLIGLLYVMC